MTRNHDNDRRQTSRDLARQWLGAERRESEREAERLLASLLTLRPLPAPTPGFADGVLARIATESQALGRRLPLELIAAGLFLTTGLVLRFVPFWLQPLLARVELPTWPSRLWQALEGLGTGLPRFVEGVQESLRLSQLVVTSPQGVLFLTLCVAVAVLSARALYGLLDNRSADDV